MFTTKFNGTVFINIVLDFSVVYDLKSMTTLVKQILNFLLSKFIDFLFIQDHHTNTTIKTTNQVINHQNTMKILLKRNKNNPLWQQWCNDFLGELKFILVGISMFRLDISDNIRINYVIIKIPIKNTYYMTINNKYNSSMT